MLLSPVLLVGGAVYGGFVLEEKAREGISNVAGSGARAIGEKVQKMKEERALTPEKVVAMVRSSLFFFFSMIYPEIVWIPLPDAC